MVSMNSLVFVALALGFAHPGEEVHGGLGGHALTPILGGVLGPGLEAVLRYHIVVVEAIKDIGQ